MNTSRVPTRLLLAALLALPLLALPSSAAQGSALTARRPTASWTGTTAAGPDCARPVDSCHVQVLDVTARQGQLVTVVMGDSSPLEVLAPDGTLVARDNVQDLRLGSGEETDDSTSDVTFEQLRSGTVRYRVRVSVLDPLARPGLDVRGTARLGGAALDRDPVCEITAVPVVTLDVGQVLPLHVRVVTSPDLLSEVKRGVPLAVEAYRGIGVRLTVSYDVTALPTGGDAFTLRAFARSRYGGRRPAGVDAVYVANQSFGGGQADCVGGVLHPELGFSVGQVRYSPENVLGDEGTGTVSPGSVLAHEVGHTVGGRHEAGNCVEGAAAQPSAGTSTESRGPCTLMSPAALTIGRTFSTLERGGIRATLLQRR